MLTNEQCLIILKEGTVLLLMERMGDPILFGCVKHPKAISISLMNVVASLCFGIRFPCHSVDCKKPPLPDT